MSQPAPNVQEEIVTLVPVTLRDGGGIEPETAQASPLGRHAFGDLGKICPDNEWAHDLHRFRNRADLCEYPRDCESAIGASPRRPPRDDAAEMVESDIFQVWRADEEQTLEDGAHHLVACASPPVAPLQEEILHAFRDLLRVLAAKNLPRQAGIDDVIALEPMQLRKTAQQVSNRHCMLPCSEPSVNRINPLLSRPSPKRPLALGHLAQKEEQNILSPVRDDSRVVETSLRAEQAG